MAKENKNSGSIRKVLVIRFRRVGDSVVSTVICSTIRKNFPEAEIHYVVNEHIGALYEHHPDIDRVITFSDDENRHFRRYVTKVRKLMKTEKYDVIIDTRSTVKTLWFSLFGWSAPFRIGTRKKYDLWLHNYRIRNQYPEAGDEAARNLMLVEPLSRLRPIEKVSEFRLYVTEEESRKFARYMEEQGIDFNRPVVVCAPLTRRVWKKWDTEKMQEVLRRIIRFYDAQLIFNFAADEKEDARILYEAMGRDPHIFIDVEAASLRELGAMFTHADFFFGNEGGPRHIAQAFRVPAFAIYSPEVNKAKWLPNACERYQGISPFDFVPAEELTGKTYQEQFAYLTVEKLWEQLQPMLDKYLKIST